MRDLVGEYLKGTENLISFYARPLHSLYDAVPEQRPWDSTLLKALGDYQGQIGSSATIAGNPLVVMTGQQPGLFTGPLYTIYKAITAVALAEKLTGKLGERCVPVFWVGADDHDFDEARTAHFYTKRHECLSLRYEPGATVDGFPMYRVPIESQIHDFVDRAAADAPGSEFAEEISDYLHESAHAAESLSDWTARLLARLFEETPLVLFTSHLPVARRLAGAVLEREIREPLASTRLLNETGKRLEELGYAPQITKADNECGFFLEVDDRRRKVVFESDEYRLPEDDLRYSVDEMLALLEEAPERFSPNVALRCVVQQHLFPAVAYVAGPGEVAYWAQLKPLFEHFEESMPVVYPRARCTLTSLKVNKLLKKYGFKLTDFPEGPDALLERALERVNRSPAVDIVREHRNGIEGGLGSLADALEKHDKTASNMARKVKDNVAGELDRLERGIIRGDQELTETVRKQVDRLCNALAPARKPQERTYNIFSYLFEHGWGFVPRLLKDIDIESFTMNEVEL